MIMMHSVDFNDVKTEVFKQKILEDPHVSQMISDFETEATDFVYRK